MVNAEKNIILLMKVGPGAVRVVLDGIRRNGFPNFDCKGCRGISQPCPLGCMNYQYQAYLCYAEDVNLDHNVNLGKKPTSTWQECEDYVKGMEADDFVWDYNTNCKPKKGNVWLYWVVGPGSRVGLFPCP